MREYTYKYWILVIPFCRQAIFHFARNCKKEKRKDGMSSLDFRTCAGSLWQKIYHIGWEWHRDLSHRHPNRMTLWPVHLHGHHLAPNFHLSPVLWPLNHCAATGDSTWLSSAERKISMKIPIYTREWGKYNANPTCHSFPVSEAFDGKRLALSDVLPLRREFLL